MNLPATSRLEFRPWTEDDLPLARRLWGDSEVMKFIDVRGGLNDEQLRQKIQAELKYNRESGTQYWPMFDRESGEFVGCCGLKPWVHSEKKGLELGFHIVKDKWGRGYAREAAKGVIEFARTELLLPHLLAGHHPEHHASKKILESLGFQFLEYVFFKPTGLMHLSYQLKF